MNLETILKEDLRACDVDYALANGLEEKLRKVFCSEISVVKPGSLPTNIDETLAALHTQYQFRADAIIPRRSADAPTLEQIGLIRDAHLNIIPILKALKAAQPERESGNLASTALRNLVNLKKHKDKHGKDDFYLSRQSDAWKLAEEAIINIEDEAGKNG